MLRNQPQVRVDESMRFAVGECILLVALQHHAVPNQRAATTIRSSPFKLLSITKLANDIRCLETLGEQSRREAARDRKAVEHRSQGPARIRGACKLELQLVDSWARYCLADKSSIEGVSNVITKAGVLAPYIKAPFLSAVCATRFFFCGIFRRGTNPFKFLR